MEKKRSKQWKTGKSNTRKQGKAAQERRKVKGRKKDVNR